ncbi:hypothetical protein [Corallococcus sp. Z5C101001]|uniref:hypothetical protein n=1 Tax=Corallococcus sp. Z5C101001 TaxID=2596829 RepID=UPI001180929E|nr:hypothetical protein [Corallococcus sp. Z5C101001]TSC20342.1 hypothetical protein FOF48_35570 [Corallococcus sp. Z5C101001]
MSFPKVVLGGGLLVGLLAAPPAEARFGKKSDASETSKPVHKASAIGADKDDDDDDAKQDENQNRPAKPPKTVSSTDDCCSSSASDDAAAIILGAVFELIFRGLGEAIAATGTHHIGHGEGPDAPPDRDSLRHAVPFSVHLGVLAAPLQHGSGVDFAIGWDVRRFGVDLRLVRLDSESLMGNSHEARTLGELHLTYSPIVREEVRMRAEVGISTLDLPQRLYVGPSLGMSVEACLLGPLDVEARMQVTPFPYRQADLRAGLALHLGSLMLRGGLRSLFLESELSPTGQSQNFGPEFGMGFTF